MQFLVLEFFKDTSNISDRRSSSTRILNNKYMNIDTIWTSTLNLLGRAWWIEILTEQPRCTYYFGPFAYAGEAEVAMTGYVEDLQSELAQGIQTHVKRCKPDQLTIDYAIDEM